MLNKILKGGDSLKLVSHQEIKEFTYESREERDEHVELMRKDGWDDCGRVRRLKVGISIWGAENNPENYEWFAEFYRYGDVK